MSISTSKPVNVLLFRLLDSENHLVLYHLIVYKNYKFWLCNTVCHGFTNAKS